MNQQLTRSPIKRLIRGIGRRWKQRRHASEREMLDPWLASSVRQIPTFSVAGPSVCSVAGAAIDGLVEVPSRRMTAFKFAAGLLATQRRRSSCQVLNGRYLGGAVAQYCLPRTVRVSQNCPQLSTGLTNQRCPRNSFWLKGWMIDASAAPCCKAARIAGHSDRLAIRTCAVSAGCSPESDRRASHAPRSPLARRPAPCPNAQDRW
jgi:hypothetical protein